MRDKCDTADTFPYNKTTGISSKSNFPAPETLVP